MIPEFKTFSKIPRWNREIIITEKIDGTNCQILITEEGEIFAGSRKRWLTLDNDNFGFAAWVKEHEDALIEELGPGRHYGEWWGHKIQRGYGLNEKRFSLFNVQRWEEEDLKVCYIVPVLYRGILDCDMIGWCLENLKIFGSKAAQGYMNPEGIVICHVPQGNLFKVTLEKDNEPKSRKGE